MTEYLETHPDVPLWTMPEGYYYLVVETTDGYCIGLTDREALTPSAWKRARTIAASPRAIHLLRAFLADGMSGQVRSEMRKLVAFVDDGAREVLER